MADRELAHQLFQCIAVSSRPLRVEELVEFFTFDFRAGPIPKLREDWRPEDPVEAVLSISTMLLFLVNVENSQVIQFSHFSVKEFLMSARFAENRNTISRRYHISSTPAHTLVVQACLGTLLHLDKKVTRDTLKTFPLAEYAARHWFEHAQFEVSYDLGDGIQQLFDRTKPHFAIWLWIHDPLAPSWMPPHGRVERPPPPRGTPLHCGAFCGLHNILNALAIEHSQDVRSRSFDDRLTPLHLASKEGHLGVARILIEHGADAAAKDNLGSTPLHRASESGHVELARFLVKHGADVAAKDQGGGLRCIGLPLRVKWSSRGSCSSTAPIPQQRTSLGRLHFIWRQWAIRSSHKSWSSTALTPQPTTRSGELRCTWHLARAMSSSHGSSSSTAPSQQQRTV